MNEDEEVGSVHDYVMSTWRFTDVPNRSYSALSRWILNETEVSAADNNSGQTHALGIIFAEKVYDYPTHFTIQLGLPSDGYKAFVHYSVRGTPDPNLPPQAWYFCLEGEMTCHVEFDPVAQTGRTYGSFHGKAEEMSDGSTHELEGTFDVVYPRP